LGPQRTDEAYKIEDHEMIKKRWVKGLAIVLAVGALGALGYYEAMKRAWIRYNEYDIRSEGSLKVGDLAPELELASVDGSGPRKISDLYREKPLVLVFGSYT
jgi:hypothetical protein